MRATDMPSSDEEPPPEDPPGAPGAPQRLGGGGLTVPVGRRVTLPGRGTTFVREAGRPDAASTVLLVHGWLASAGLNWAPAFVSLTEDFRVVAADLRGHGRGIRSRHRFRLEDCADDLAALVDHLGCGPVIVVGYSMGGLVAQLVWRRRPDLVAGLVLCSTTRVFVAGRRQRYLVATTLNYAAGTVRATRMARQWYGGGWYPPIGLGLPGLRRRPTSMRMWAAAELRRHDLRQVFEAGHAASQFDSRAWIAGVDVPTAVVVTTKDRAIPPDAQLQVASSIAGCTVHTIDDDHTACAHAAFGPVLLAACRDVGARLGKDEAVPRTTCER